MNTIIVFLIALVCIIAIMIIRECTRSPNRARKRDTRGGLFGDGGYGDFEGGDSGDDGGGD